MVSLVVGCGAREREAELARRAAEIQREVERPAPEPVQSPIRGGTAPSRLDADGLRWEVVSGSATDGLLFVTLQVSGDTATYRERRDNGEPTIVKQGEMKLAGSELAAIAAEVRTHDLCPWRSDRAAEPGETLTTLAIRAAGVDCELTLRERDWPKIPQAAGLLRELTALRERVAAVATAPAG